MLSFVKQTPTRRASIRVCVAYLHIKFTRRTMSSMSFRQLQTLVGWPRQAKLNFYSKQMLTLIGTSSYATWIPSDLGIRLHRIVSLTYVKLSRVRFHVSYITRMCANKRDNQYIAHTVHFIDRQQRKMRALVCKCLTF